MRVLFDQRVPAPLRKLLGSHEVATAYELGWSELENGELLAAAETEGFEVFVTTERNLRYQQNLARRHVAIVVLSTPGWPRVRDGFSAVVQAVDKAAVGSFLEVTIS